MIVYNSSFQSCDDQGICTDKVDKVWRYLSFLPPANEVWGRQCFHRHLSIRGWVGSRVSRSLDWSHGRIPPGHGYHPHGGDHRNTYGWQAGGTHPTGMLFCYILIKAYVKYLVTFLIWLISAEHHAHSCRHQPITPLVRYAIKSIIEIIIINTNDIFPNFLHCIYFQ